MRPASYQRKVGRATAQAVSRLLPTAAARVRARVWSCGISGGQSGAGAGSLRVLRFPLPIFIKKLHHNHQPSCVIWGWYSRPVVTAVHESRRLGLPRISCYKISSTLDLRISRRWTFRLWSSGLQRGWIKRFCPHLYPEDGGIRFFRNIGTTLHTGRPHFSLFPQPNLHVQIINNLFF
jgi:hypothetical protein